MREVYRKIQSIIFFLLLGGVVTLVHILAFYPDQATEHADCIVVFGAAVWPGYYGPVASNALKDRTLAASDIYKSGLSNCILLSGADSIYGAHEVDVMTDILLEYNVPEDVIELDRSGINTMTTINNLDKTRSYILVSNDFHLARIGLLAQRAGLSNYGFELHAAKYRSGGRYIKEPYFTLREVVAFWYYFFVTLI